MNKVDWSVFKQYSENTIYCKCGAVYRSHCKMITNDGVLDTITEKPCPSCDSTIGHVRRALSDVEVYHIGE